MGANKRGFDLLLDGKTTKVLKRRERNPLGIATSNEDNKRTADERK